MKTDTLFCLQKTLIEFTLSGTTYQAEDGMTWEEWVGSEYNTSKWRKDGSNIVFAACGYVHYNNILIQSSEIIDSSKQYSVTPCSN